MRKLTIGDSNLSEGGNETLAQRPPAIPTEQKCNYCGRTLDQQSAACAGCGALRVPPVIAKVAQPVIANVVLPTTMETPILNGRNATLILGAFLAGQFCFAAIVGFVYGFGEAIKGAGGSLTNHAELTRSILAPATLLGFIGGGIAMIWLSRTIVKKALDDTSEIGAAWVVGRRKDIGKGLLIGFSVALIYIIPSSFLQPPKDEDSLGPLTRMAMTPGFPQIAWITMALLLAPPLEEMLFRGVLYGGYRKALGATWAAWLTTGIFTLLHITEAIHYLPALVAIAGMALLALRMRLQSSAIGPAIAVHFGYNFVVAVGVICSTWFRDGKG
jgi:membrane protease YdiL (CAAX protease family)